MPYTLPRAGFNLKNPFQGKKNLEGVIEALWAGVGPDQRLGSLLPKQTLERHRRPQTRATVQELNSGFAQPRQISGLGGRKMREPAFHTLVPVC